MTDERRPTEPQLRIAALPEQLRALVAGMDAVHYGPHKIVAAAAEELEKGHPNWCGVCKRRWHGAEGPDRMCQACVAASADLVARIKGTIDVSGRHDIQALVYEILNEIAEAAPPIPGQLRLRLFSPGYACPLCGEVTQAGPGFTMEGLRGHLFGRTSQYPCTITGFVLRQLQDWRKERYEAEAREAEARREAEERAEPGPGRPEYCYLIRCEGSGNVKIGKAVDVARRLVDLQRGSGARLTVIASIEADDGLALESQMHDRFTAHRLYGEWFSPAPEILAAFKVS